MKGDSGMQTKIKDNRNSGAGFRLSNPSILMMMALPCIVLVVLFSYVPLFGWTYAFIRFQPGKGIFQSQFIGLANFARIFSSSEIVPVLRNTLVLSFMGLALTPVPALFAIILSEMKNRYFRSIIQTTTTFPNFISWIIVYSISMIIFSVDDGFLNQLLLHTGLTRQPLNLLGSSNAVWFLQTGINLWKGLGFNSIIYFAAISGIDTELYDAAAVDGAGRFRRIWHIKIPGILSTYLVLLLLSVGSILNNGFEQYYVFYNPLVHSHIQVLDLYVYKIGMEGGDYSFSTAVGIFKTAVSVTLLFSVNMLARKTSDHSIL